jgi:GT2 family glycosyltransferase
VGGKITSIIILNLNGKAHLDRCLTSVGGYTATPYELIVIDNGSTDGSPEYLRGVEANNLTVVENPENLGPSARVQGMALAQGDYVLFLDNDTWVTSSWLERLIGHMGNDPSIGLMGPSTNYIDGQQMIPGVKYEDIAELADIAAIMATNFAGVLQPSIRMVGFCLCIRRAVIDKIGGLDSRFGKYGFEDDDFAWRSVLAGFDSYIARDVFIHHTGNQGSVGGGLDYPKLVREAWDKFHAKWGLPADMDFYGYLGGGYNLIPDRPFDPDLDYVALPDLAEVEPLITRRDTWRWG